MVHHRSIFDELYKRRRPRTPERPAHYACDDRGLTLADAWYSTPLGAHRLSDVLPSSAMQALLQFDPAFINSSGQYEPVYRIATPVSPAVDAMSRRWQLLDEIIRHGMRQHSVSAWQQAQLVIYDPLANHAAGAVLDAWLSHWPSAARPQGGITLTSLPFFEWLAQRLAQAKDTHCHICFVALEAADPASGASSPGESTTVLWLQRWLVDDPRPTQGIELTSPVFSNAPFSTESITALLAQAPASEAWVWDGHDPSQLTSLLKARAHSEALGGLEDDAFWSLSRLAGQLHHFDALQVALAAHASYQKQCKALALNTFESTQSGFVHLKPATASHP